MKKGRKMCGNRDASEKYKPWVSQPKAKDMGVFVCLLPPKVTNPHYRKILHFSRRSCYFVGYSWDPASRTRLRLRERQDE